MGKTRRFNKKRAYKKRRTIRKQRKSRKHYGGVKYPVCEGVTLMPIDRLKPSSMAGRVLSSISSFGNLGEKKYIIFYDDKNNVILEGTIQDHDGSGISIIDEKLTIDSGTTCKTVTTNDTQKFTTAQLSEQGITQYQIVKKLRTSEGCQMSCQ